ncbi:MAG: ACT domain-containing protein [Armatimonadota bacterium]|nr:ACT domain-containing protein [Armatimonadota bacterium]MDR5696305.1 ACT domain-containing protein [Armatimonadota bacterium]
MRHLPQPLVDPELAAVLANTKILVEPEPLAVVSLPLSEAQAVQRRADRFHSPFCLAFSPDEVSLVCREVEWDQAGRGLRPTRVERDYRMITLDAVLDASVIGYLSVVTERLARAGIPVCVVSTFHRDHLLVRAADADAAQAVLQALIAECRKRAGS